MKTPIAWLEKEIVLWQEESLISAENAEKVLAKYQNAPQSSKLALVIFSIVGASLIGLGIISILAYNWEELNHAVKAAVAFILLFVAQGFAFYTYKYHFDSTAYKEGASVLWLTLFTAALAIIAQTYNLGGTIDDFIKIVVFLSLPILYIFNPVTAATVLYAVIITLFTAEKMQEHSLFTVTLLLVMWLPWYANRLYKKPYAYSTHFLNLCFAVGTITLINIFQNFGLIHLVLLNLTTIAIAWLLYVIFYNSTNKFYPVETLAKISLLLYLLIGSTEMILDRFNGEFDTLLTLVFIPYLLLLGAFVWLRRERIYELLIPLTPLIVLAADYMEIEYYFFATIVTVIIALGAAFMVFGGAKTKNFALANWGIALLAILVCIKFFDSHYDFLVKGLAFIVIGILFLGTNLLIKRLWSGNDK